MICDQEFILFLLVVNVCHFLFNFSAMITDTPDSNESTLFGFQCLISLNHACHKKQSNISFKPTPKDGNRYSLIYDELDQQINISN